MNLTETDVVSAIHKVIQQPHGWCYAASEAAYHLLGGKEAGYTPMVASYYIDLQRFTHWWLRRPDGTVLDITEGQFPYPFKYSWGKGCGFLTKKPSKRAQEIIDALDIPSQRYASGAQAHGANSSVGHAGRT